jgi:hypothetical protein
MITRQKILHHKLHWIALACFFLVLISTLLLCIREADVTTDSFLGVWKTSAPKYKDRFFKITESTITFATGNGNSKIFIVDRVSKTVEQKKTVYTISYNDVEGTDFKLAFYYTSKNKGVIRFKNQQEIEWARINP